MFHGSIVALVTPFREDALDERAFQRLIAWHLEEGTQGFVPVGTTGESPTLSHPEHERVIELCVEAVGGRAPVIAGTGSNSTEEAISLTRHAKRAGADAALVVTPYYNKPTQEGLFQHYRAVAAVGLPVVLYNVPGRTGCDLLPETVARLCELPQVVALKEATGTVQRTQQVLARVGDRLTLLSGEDALNYPLYCVGARGCISVVSNVAPWLVSGCYDAVCAGEHDKARALHYRSLPLADALFLESNPIPTKAALAMLGRMSPELRLPLCPMTDSNQKKLRAVLVEQGHAKQTRDVFKRYLTHGNPGYVAHAWATVPQAMAR